MASERQEALGHELLSGSGQCGKQAVETVPAEVTCLVKKKKKVASKMYKGLCLFFSKPEEHVSMRLLDQEQAVFSCGLS